MEEDLKFDLNAIEQTLANYKKNSIYDGVVVAIREDGVIFNIGGKSDAFIRKDDFQNFADVKIGSQLATGSPNLFFIVHTMYFGTCENSSLFK